MAVQRNSLSYDWTSPTTSSTHSINYRVEGDPSSDPILLVHGFGVNSNHFRYNVPLLVESGYRVYAIDLLGFGASDKPIGEVYSIDLWTQLLCDFIKDQHDGGETNGNRWVIGGNSIGGLSSLAVSKRIPDRILGCVLFNAAGGMTFRISDVPLLLRPVVFLLRLVLLGPLGPIYFQNFKTRDNVETILRSSGVYGDTSNVDEELLELILAPSDDEGAQDVFLKVFTGPAGPTPESLLPDVRCPVLALWGDSDPWTPLDSGAHPGNGFAEYAEGDFELVELEGVGHCPHDEIPEKIHESMLPWLQRLSTTM